MLERLGSNHLSLLFLTCHLRSRLGLCSCSMHLPCRSDHKVVMPMVRARAIDSRESESLDNRRVPFRERVPRGVISRAGLELVTRPAERHPVRGNVRSALPEFNDVVDLEEFS